MRSAVSANRRARAFCSMGRQARARPTRSAIWRRICPDIQRTAEQVAYLGAYMSLARLLQPTMVVIEDVDLIARQREEMGGPCEEALLNKLLNEMDGLKEDADITAKSMNARTVGRRNFEEG